MTRLRRERYRAPRPFGNCRAEVNGQVPKAPAEPAVKVESEQPVRP